ncbi:MAG: heme ABC transporter permease [Alphaproteobacteria bacterium]|nr:heme ABC transporter permease [Alphaproteobacteria bacterium]
MIQNVTRLRRWINLVLPWAAVLAVILLCIGGYWGLVLSPADIEQGETVRIIYIHVPAASIGLLIYAMIAVQGFVFLVWRAPVADIMLQAALPIGAIYTFLALATGSLWGKPMWGAWWVWDARLTSTLILFFLYLGIMILRRSFEDQEMAAKSSALLAMIGGINVPIIKFSVDWWFTLHQPASILRLDGSTIHNSFLYPLLVMMAAFATLFLVLWMVRIKTILLSRRLDNLYRLSHQNRI